MPLMPVAMLVPEKDVPAPPRPIREYVQDLTKQLQLVRQQVLKRDEQVADGRNLIPVGSDEVWSLLPGDEVLVYAPYLPTNTEHRKHFIAWKGPFFVSKEIAADVFEVVGIEAGVPTAYHRSKLKRYERLTLSRHAYPLVPLHSSSWTGKSSMRSRRCLTIVKSEGRDSTSFNGKAPLNPHGSGRLTSIDAWISLRSTSAGLASKDAFSRLSSPVQCRRALREEEEPLLQELPRCLLP